MSSLELNPMVIEIEEGLGKPWSNLSLSLLVATSECGKCNGVIVPTMVKYEGDLRSVQRVCNTCHNVVVTENRKNFKTTSGWLKVYHEKE